MDKEAATALVQYLQAHPMTYRHFVWLWWHIKAELKRFGFNSKHLNHLGDYSDPWATKHYDGIDGEALTELAVAEQLQNAKARWGSNESTLPDGSRYILLDLDVE